MLISHLGMIRGLIIIKVYLIGNYFQLNFNTKYLLKWYLIHFKSFDRLGTELKSESEKKDAEVQELKKVIEQQKRDIEVLNEEIDAVKEQNSRAPTTTMKNLVERLKNQLALKEKQHQVGEAWLSWKHTMTLIIYLMIKILTENLLCKEYLSFILLFVWYM